MQTVQRGIIDYLMNDPRFRLTASQAAEVVAQFGTPFYVLDEATLREKMRAYKAAFEGRLSFAAKANPASAVLAIAAQEGFGIDVASEGELRAAIHGGVRAHACTLHGNNKSLREIQFALLSGVGEIVADSFQELEMLAQLDLGTTTLLLRLAPGVDPITHEKIATGQEDTKFGFNITSGDAEQAVRYSLEHGLPLAGLHCHVGSQLMEPSAQIAGGEALARFAVEMFDQYGWRCELLNVGGGLGIRYTEEECMPIADYCEAIVKAVRPILDAAGLDPLLAQEPGRSLVAEAGVTLYTVGAVKFAAGRRYVVVDGGLAENPRPALYGAEYAVERVCSHSEIRDLKSEMPTPESEIRNLESEMELTPPPNPLPNFVKEGEVPTRLSGRHCETDTVVEDVELPDDIQPGDVLQMLSTGAYSSSMASNYNRYPRPATVLIRSLEAASLPGELKCTVIQRAETQDELLAREQVPDDLRQTKEHP